jgi:hypothetical protein
MGTLGLPVLAVLVVSGLGLLLMELAGSVVNGTVTKLDSSTDPEGVRHCRISYAYQVGRVGYQQDAEVAPAAGEQLQKDGPVAVLVGPLLPESNHRLLVEGARNPWEGAVMPAILCLVLYGIPGSGLLRSLRRASKHRRLISIGLPTCGTIRDGPRGRWQIAPADAPSGPGEVSPPSGTRSDFQVAYSYQMPEGSADGPGVGSLEAVMDLPEDYALVPIGEAITVLYDPADPRQSVIYRLADYEAVPRLASVPPGMEHAITAHPERRSEAVTTTPESPQRAEADSRMNPILEAVRAHLDAGKQIISVSLHDHQHTPTVTFTFADGWQWALPLEHDSGTISAWWEGASRFIRLVGQIRLVDERPEDGTGPDAERE